MKHIFIINDHANHGLMIEKISDLEGACLQKNLNYKLLFPKSKEETLKIAKFYKHQDAIVYAVGGDGTINTVLNGLVGGTATLGIIPYGTGNDFYRTLEKYPDGIITANVMKVNDQYALNIFSIGIDALICKNAQELQNGLIPDSLLYYAGMAKSFFTYQNEPLLMLIDGKRFYGYASFLAICNGGYYGHGVNINPQENITKAFPSIYFIADLKKREYIPFLFKIFKSTHLSDKHTNIFHGSDIKIIADYPVYGNIDGEIVLSDEFDIQTNAASIDIANNQELIKLIRTKKS